MHEFDDGVAAVSCLAVCHSLSTIFLPFFAAGRRTRQDGNSLAAEGKWADTAVQPGRLHTAACMLALKYPN